MRRCGVEGPSSRPRLEIQTALERAATEGDSPVEKTEQDLGEFLSTAPRKRSGKLGAINFQP